ncbi:hypothetical protein OH77DRAFT_1429299 [Trametes cingulata]|nr:hypothetical protein OH77DRAFT_1429299 [Trametes cingulata]
MDARTSAAGRSRVSVFVFVFESRRASVEGPSCPFRARLLLRASLSPCCRTGTARGVKDNWATPINMRLGGGANGDRKAARNVAAMTALLLLPLHDVGSSSSCAF